MKTIQEVKADRDECLQMIEDAKKDKQPRQVKRLTKKIPWYKDAILYIETNPIESFVQNEIDRLKGMLELRKNMFVVLPEFLTKEQEEAGWLNKMKKQHEVKYEMPKLREQLRMLQYIKK